jgi:hypothetical protein
MYNLISTKKTKVMALKGNFPVTAKIIIDNNISEQISHFSYLRSVITHTLRRMLQTETTKETRLRFYKAVVIPTFLYGH